MKKVFVKCRSCGWAHFALTEEVCKKEVREFNRFYKKLSKEYKRYYDKPSSIYDYKSCFRCGGSYKNMRRASSDDAPIGSTIQSIMLYVPKEKP